MGTKRRGRLMGMALSQRGREALSVALDDEDVLQRYAAKVVTVPGSGCWWWTGAVSGRGHGRFWIGGGRVVIAHRFAWAMTCGVEALGEVSVLGLRCDNPLCQRVGSDHVVESSPIQNRREWAARRSLAGGALGDPRGARQRAVELRDLARADPARVAAHLQGQTLVCGEQPRLF